MNTDIILSPKLFYRFVIKLDMAVSHLNYTDLSWLLIASLMANWYFVIYSFTRVRSSDLKQMR